MRKLFYTMLMSIVLILSIQSTKAQVDSRGYIVKAGDMAPDNFVLQLTNGKSVTLKELRGHVVLLQFTASWCSVCRAEMPHLENEIWKVYGNKGLVFIGIDRDEPIDTVKKFATTMNISYPLALDPGAEIFGKFADKKAGVTRNVLIDKEGKIVFLTRLYNEKEFAALKQNVQKLFL